MFDFRAPRFRPFDALLDLVYPRCCVVCGCALDDCADADDDQAALSREILLCKECRAALVTPGEELCPFCSGSAFFTENDTTCCGSCRTRTFRFKRVIALGPYRELLRSRVLIMKRQATGETALALARLLFYARTEDFRAVGCDRVVPVPRYFLRRLTRGTNDAVFLAAELARLLSARFDGRSLRRIRSTRPQASVRRDERIANVAGAFAVRKNRHAKNRARPFEGERILLVDDILTTGATADEITRVLLEAGAKSVVVAVCARAEGRIQRG